MLKTPKKRRAFTLVELLVVMAVIGVLVSLLLPAIQQARETARRTQCSNHLKQQGLALQTYHDAHQIFPASYYSDTKAPIDSGTFDGPGGWAWGTMLLPYLERGDLHGQLRFDRSCWDAVNSAAVKSRLPVFMCPSSSGNNETELVVRDQAGNPLARFGRSTYVANAGKEEPWGFAIDDYSRVADGPMFRNSRVRAADVSDGLSYTVFLGEHSSYLSAKTWVGVVPGAVVCTENPNRFPLTACDYAATLVNVHSGPAADEIDPITGFAPVHPPNSALCHVCQMFAEHPGGANVALGDGSVRFISSHIKHLVWAALSSRAHGESISGEF